MAKDTEKLIRQLSLISYLMAERRPVTALEIRRDVEGYSGMNEDAFARRFYADRSELESLRIQLTVERPADGAAEQENYSLRPENFHLPAIAFTDKELAALQTALSLLDGEFAYAEPLRLALQQITWGRPSPLRAPEQRSVALGITASAGGHELSARLAKVETAIFRNKTIAVRLLHDGARRGRRAPRRSLPPAVPGRPVLPARLRARAQGDPRLPPLADPRQGLLRDQGRARLPPARRLRPARVRQPRRLAARRASGASPRCSSPSGSPGRSNATSGATARSASEDGEDGSFLTGYSSPRGIVSWVLGLGAQRAPARPGGADRASSQRRLELLEERHGDAPPMPPSARRVAAATGASRGARISAARARARAAARDARGDGETAAAARRGGDPPGALRAPGDAREHPDQGRSRGRARRRSRRSASACRSARRSCARTSTC